MMMEDSGYISINEATIDPITQKVTAFERYFTLPGSDNEYVGKIKDDYSEVSGEYVVQGKKGTFTWVFTEADDSLKSQFSKKGYFDGKYTDPEGKSKPFVGVVNLDQGKITLSIPDSSETWFGTVNMINRRVILVKEEGKVHNNPVFTGIINEELSEIVGDNIQVNLLQED